MNAEKLEKLKQNVRIGGKGTVRRKHKGVRKAAAGDDKKLHAALKRLGVNTLPQVEEVCLYKDDGNVLVFQNPKVQASIAANTYVVSGTPTEKKAELQDILPGLFNNLPPEQLKKLQEQLANTKAAGNTAAADDEVPELVETFDKAAKTETKTEAKVETHTHHEEKHTEAHHEHKYEPHAHHEAHHEHTNEPHAHHEAHHEHKTEPHAHHEAHHEHKTEPHAHHEAQHEHKTEPHEHHEAHHEHHEAQHEHKTEPHTHTEAPKAEAAHTEAPKTEAQKTETPAHAT